MAQYTLGARIRVSATFKVADVLTDPTAVVLKVRDPAGVIATYNYPPPGTIVRASVGSFYADIQPDAKGDWHYRWEGAGAAVGASEGHLLVRSRF